MKYLRLPSPNELQSWRFQLRGEFIQLRLNLHLQRLPVLKSTGIKLPTGYRMLFQPVMKQWYVDGTDQDKARELTGILQDIYSRLSIGMKKGEWERAIPELWPRVASMTVLSACERYLQWRITGTEYHDKAKPATLKGIRAARACWLRFNQDMNIFRLVHATNVDQDAKKEIDKLLRGFVLFMKNEKLSQATQKVHLFWVKSSIYAMAQEFDLFIPESVDKIQINVASTDVVVIDNQDALKALAELTIDRFKQKDALREAILCAKIMFTFGLRISDAVGLTLANFSDSDQGTVLRVISQKTKKYVPHLVPEALWVDIQFCLRRWNGRVVYLRSNNDTDRVRKNMMKVIKRLPGMNTPIQRVKINPDGSSEIYQTTLADEFKPHMLRKTSGTINHLVTGAGFEHLGNTEQVFRSKYLSREQINFDKQREFHAALGFIDETE